MSVQDQKRAMRRAMRELRRGVSPAEATRVGAALALHVGSLPEFARAAQVAVFVSLPDEVDTRPLLDLVVSSGKCPLLPRCRQDGRLDFAVSEALDSLCRRPDGLREPGPECEVVEPGSDALVLVPGVAFDRRGNRLGRGGGFYDRTFPPGLAAPTLIGLAFAFQLVDRVPTNEHDRRMDSVATEDGVLRSSSGSQSTGPGPS